nr:MAG TPA: NlpE N-terminal domain [Caudoviricetes sp.]
MAVHIVANMEVLVWTKPRRQRPRQRKPAKRKAETPPRKRKPRNSSRKSKSMIGAKWNSFVSSFPRCKTSLRQSKKRSRPFPSAARMRIPTQSRKISVRMAKLSTSIPCSDCKEIPWQQNLN